MGREFHRVVRPFHEVVVKTAAQLSGTLRSDVSYLIDGIIDMGSSQITVPQGGLTMHGLDLNISGLTTSETSHTLFIDDGVFAGNLFLREMFVTVSGSGSQVFDLDNDGNGGAVECTEFNFVSCKSLGTLDAYRQGLWDGFALIACVDGLTMEGTWVGGFAILTSIVVSAGTAFTGTILKKGSALVVNGSIRSDMNALQLDSAGAICDFAPANITNDTEFLMTGVRVNSSSTSFPNMPASSVKARFIACTGTENTHIGGQWTISATATTTIASSNTPVKLAGTTTYIDLQHFTGTANNAITYIGTDTADIVISGVVPLTGTNNNVVNAIIRQWDNSASSYIDISQSGGVTMNAGNRAEGVSLEGIAKLDTSDRIEVWVENQSSSANITADLGGLIHISER